MSREQSPFHVNRIYVFGAEMQISEEQTCCRCWGEWMCRVPRKGLENKRGQERKKWEGIYKVTPSACYLFESLNNTSLFFTPLAPQAGFWMASSICLYSLVTAEGDKALEKIPPSISLRLWVKFIPFTPTSHHPVSHGMRTASVICFL